MNDLSLLPPPDTPWILTKSVLDEAGLTGELLLLAPGAERIPEQPAAGDTLLLVIAGSVTARTGLAHHILPAETALLVPAGRPWALSNPGAAPAKLFALAIPPPRIAERPPELVTLVG